MEIYNLGLLGCVRVSCVPVQYVKEGRLILTTRAQSQRSWGFQSYFPSSASQAS